MVLGISTIIMFVVLACVGYEKLIGRAGINCYYILICRKKIFKKKPSPGSVSPEPLVDNEEGQNTKEEDGASNSSTATVNDIRY